ncbi:MAG: hypothetical protein ACXWYN_11090 [Actinomycetota bacterium]
MYIIGGGEVDPKAWDFEARQWVVAFEGPYSKAKELIARLDAENIRYRLTMPEEPPKPIVPMVILEVMRGSLPLVRDLLAELDRPPSDTNPAP